MGATLGQDKLHVGANEVTLNGVSLADRSLTAMDDGTVEIKGAITTLTTSEYQLQFIKQDGLFSVRIKVINPFSDLVAPNGLWVRQLTETRLLELATSIKKVMTTDCRGAERWTALMLVAALFAQNAATRPVFDSTKRLICVRPKHCMPMETSFSATMQLREPDSRFYSWPTGTAFKSVQTASPVQILPG